MLDTLAKQCNYEPGLSGRVYFFTEEMMEKMHTPEPWAIFDGDPRAIVTVANPMLSLLSVGDDGLAIMYEESDARRIVACVNACAGIPTELLERFKTIVGSMDEVSKIEKQRDELLAAIETTLDENGHLADGDNCTLILLKRAAASVKGGVA